MSTECKSKCGTEIIWRKHITTGRAMPIEAVPSLEGNIVLGGDNKTYRIANEQEFVKNRIADVPTLYISHFARCPKADKFRSKFRRQPKNKS